MNPLVTSALIMLASAYGCSSPTTYPQIIDCEFIYEYASDHNLFFDDTLFIQNDVYSIYGSNKYAIFSCNNQNFIVDKDKNVVLKYMNSFNGASLPETSFYIYESNEILEFDAYNYQVVYIDTNEIISVSLARNDVTFGDLFIEDELPAGGEMLIPDWYYFANLKKHYGYNANNECGIIASQIMLGYYDIFKNDLLVDEVFETGGLNNANDSEIIANWPTDSTPGTDDRDGNSVHVFREYLEENYFSDFNYAQNGLFVGEVETALDNYLDDKNLAFNLDTYSFARIPVHAKAVIDNGRPVILGGVQHFCVAFGYNETKFFVNDGNGRVGTIPMSAYQGVNQLIWSTGCIDIQGGYHVHSDNYYSTYHGTFYCPCGAKIKNAAINPNNWGFEAQYYFYDKYKQHTVGNLSFETNRLRTGFIENEVVNLSPRRQNAGNSYLRIVFQNIITKVDINMGWWSNNEHQNDGTAMLYYKDTVGVNAWYTLNNILNNSNMSQSHSNLSYYSFVMPEEAEGIMFNVANQAVGDTNKGRLSLGQINIRYITYLPVS